MNTIKSEKPLNILYMIGDRGTDLSRIEGYRVHVTKIIEYITLVGHEITLLTINDNPAKTGMPNICKSICIKHRYARLIHRIFPYTGFIDSMAILKSIWKINKCSKIDVIHERFGLYSFGGVLASRLMGIPYVLEINGPNIEEKQLFTKPLLGWQKRVAVFIRKICMFNSDIIISVSNVLKDIMVNEWKVAGHNIVVMPNAADVQSLLKAAETMLFRKANYLEDSFLIGFVGTLQLWYGLDVLVDAVPYIVESIPNAKVVFVGDGHARIHLEEKIKKIGLSKHVLLLGSKPHEEIPEILKTLDVAVAPYVDLPTGFFNSPIKIFEYLAAGKAIVASDIGQIPEIVEHYKTGLLVKPGDPYELAKAVIQIANDHELKTRLEGAARDEGKKYSWENYAKKLINIYYKL